MKLCTMRKHLCALMCLLWISSGTATGATIFDETDKNVLIHRLNQAKTAISRTPMDMVAYKSAGLAALQLARLGEKNYADQAVTFLTRAVEGNRDDALLLAFLGSSHALYAQESTFVVQRISRVKTAIKTLNEAVSKNPEDITVRLVRGSVAFELPHFFEQEQTAFDDFSFIESHFSKNADLPPSLKAEIYYKLGCLAKKRDDDDAKNRFFNKAQQAAPDSGWATKAKQK